MRKYILIIVFALLVFLCYRPVKETILSLRGVTYEDGVLSCDYQGRTYHANEQRQADDGCNVCTCGSTGWSCTKIVCAAGLVGTGTVTGTLASPNGKAVLAQRVCAVNLKNEEKEFCQQTTDGSTEYVIAAKPGDYWVYAMRLGDESGKRAYWSEYVKCGALASCKDHSPILVTVASGQISKADPMDWSSAVQIDLINVTPSKWVYNTHNYYQSSVFLVKGRGLSSVKIMMTPYPPKPDAQVSEFGQAERQSEAGGIQTWTIPIPKGFEAGTVYAVGTNPDGEFTKSHELRIVRSIETAE